MVLTFDKRQICSEHLQLRFNMIKNLLCLFSLNRFITMCNASVNPSCPLPPRGYHGASPRLFSPGGGAFANFALPGGMAFVNLKAIPKLLTRSRFPIRI